MRWQFEHSTAKSWTGSIDTFVPKRVRDGARKLLRHHRSQRMMRQRIVRCSTVLIEHSLQSLPKTDHEPSPGCLTYPVSHVLATVPAVTCVSDLLTPDSSHQPSTMTGLRRLCTVDLHAMQTAAL